MARLIVTEGELAGREFDLNGDFSIGRENADLVLADAEASRHHALLRATPDTVEIEDLDSLNGTWVNGERLSGAISLRDGATIRIGSTTLVVELRAAPPAPTRVASQPVAPATELRASPAPAPAPAHRAAPAPERAPAGAGAPVGAPTFAGARPRPRAVATRLWLPAAITFAIIIATAIALLVYFASR